MSTQTDGAVQNQRMIGTHTHILQQTSANYNGAQNVQHIAAAAAAAGSDGDGAFHAVSRRIRATLARCSAV